MADRQLDDKQAEQIISAINKFSGQAFDVTAYRDTKESLNIANRIAETMTRAGWKYVPPPSPSFMFGGITGVQVWIHPAAEEYVRNAGSALVQALQKVGIAAELRLQSPKNPKESKIHLNVGTKP
jgi:hypothetical protein